MGYQRENHPNLEFRLEKFSQLIKLIHELSLVDQFLSPMFFVPGGLDSLF
jgi:hypothetical protein